MKKFFALLALVLGVVSCQTEPEGFDVNVGGEQEVMLNVSLPEATRATSAEGFDLNNLGDYSIRYILEIAYNGHVLRDVQVSESKTVTFPVRLAPGRNYQFTVWADLVKEGQNDLYYKVLEGAQDDVSALANIELKNWTPNVEARDAWTDTKSFRFGEDDLEMTLTRPFAKVRVVATDIAEIRKFGIVPTNAVVEYFETEMYTKFDAVAGAAKGETTSKTLEFAYADVDTYADVTGQFTVFADYVLVPADGNVQFTLSVYDNTKGNDALIKTNNFNTTIPVAKNKVTSIVGNVLTDGDNITVKVEDAFENGSAWNPSTDDYDVELWDGVTIEEPAYDETTKTYTIKNGNHLAWVAAAVNGTLPAETRATIEPKSFKGETIKLAKDINLNFENWTPIGIPTGYNNLFNGTFDGDGHKVANLRVDNNKGAGLFGATTGATIKNVVIDNVRLNTNHYAGAVVAWAESGAVAVKLENCVVKNAEVTVKAELVDGEWDNGDKGAALIGFAHAVNIADCKVENVKVTAYRDFAGLVGYADKTSIANCETANVELEQDLTHNYKDETPDTYGEVIGRNGGGNKIDGEDFVATATQLQAAVDAATGETTLCLGNDIVGDVTVVQKPGVKITINGRGFKYNGSIKVHSNSNYYADAALTIKKVNFETATASTNVIEALENGSQRYSNNITVEDCTFTATDAAINTSVAVQVKATRGVTVKNCTANNMHSLIQAQSCDTGDVKVIDCTVNGKNGVAFKQVKSATVEGTTITALEYGIRFDGNIDNYGIVVKNNNVTAAQPFIVRKMTGKNNTITLEGTNTLTTEAEYQIVVTNGSDDEEYVKPTGTYTLTGADAYTVFPALPVAKIGTTEYTSIDEAIANWTNGTTLTLIANVTLNDVITLKSTEYHILNLGTYTLTAAKGKDAISISNEGRSKASYALDIKADENNIGGITATSKAVVKTTGKSGVQDRPIIRFYNGVYNASNVISHSGSSGTNCPQFQFHNGIFNGSISTNRALIQIYGGTFNGRFYASVDSSAYMLISGGKFKYLDNLYGSALNSDKFTIGSSKGNYDRGIYVDDEGYFVVGGAVITEFGDMFAAKATNASKAGSYLPYSSAAANGLYYTNAQMAIDKHGEANVVLK